MSFPALVISPDVANEPLKNDDVSTACAPQMRGSPQLGGGRSPLGSACALGGRRTRGVGNKSHRATSHLKSYVPFSSLERRLPSSAGTATRIAAHPFASAPNDTGRSTPLRPIRINLEHARGSAKVLRRCIKALNDEQGGTGRGRRREAQGAPLKGARKIIEVTSFGACDVRFDGSGGCSTLALRRRQARSLGEMRCLSCGSSSKFDMGSRAAAASRLPQRINRLPCAGKASSKVSLARSIARMRLLRPAEYSFAPQQWILHSQKQAQAFFSAIDVPMDQQQRQKQKQRQDQLHARENAHKQKHSQSQERNLQQSQASWTADAEADTDTFIAKPDHTNQGNGIVVFQRCNANVLKRRLLPSKKWGKVLSKYGFVVQRYIQAPMLLSHCVPAVPGAAALHSSLGAGHTQLASHGLSTGLSGRKWDIRLFVLVTSVRPLRMYLCREALARFAAQPYAEPTSTNVSDNTMHLTNYAINKCDKTLKAVRTRARQLRKMQSGQNSAQQHGTKGGQSIGESVVAGGSVGTRTLETLNNWRSCGPCVHRRISGCKGQGFAQLNGRYECGGDDDVGDGCESEDEGKVEDVNDADEADDGADDGAIKKALSSLLPALSRAGLDAPSLWQQLEHVALHTMIAVLPPLALHYGSLLDGNARNHGAGARLRELEGGYQQRLPPRPGQAPQPRAPRQEPPSCAFHLFGLDVLLDAHGKAWLLELNDNPSLRWDGDEDKHVKECVAGAMLRVVLRGFDAKAEEARGDDPRRITQLWPRTSTAVSDIATGAPATGPVLDTDLLLFDRLRAVYEAHTTRPDASAVSRGKVEWSEMDRAQFIAFANKCGLQELATSPTSQTTNEAHAVRAIVPAQETTVGVASLGAMRQLESLFEQHVKGRGNPKLDLDSFLDIMCDLAYQAFGQCEHGEYEDGQKRHPLRCLVEHIERCIQHKQHKRRK